MLLDGTASRDWQKGVAEGTLFRHFANKKAILIEVQQGWIEILADLLTELSGWVAIGLLLQMCGDGCGFSKNADMMRGLLYGAQFSSGARSHSIKVIDKMTDVTKLSFKLQWTEHLSSISQDCR